MGSLVVFQVSPVHVALEVAALRCNFQTWSLGRIFVFIFGFRSWEFVWRLLIYPTMWPKICITTFVLRISGGLDVVDL